MSILQLPNSKSTDSNELPSEVQENMQGLADFVLSQLPSGPTSPEEFEGVEIKARDVGMAVSRKIIKDHLEAQNRHYPKRIEQGGQTWYRAKPTRHTIITAVGSVEFERCRYRTGKPGLSLFPVDDSLGLVDGHLTRRAGLLSVEMTSHCPPREAHEIFRKMGMLEPSASTLHRVTRLMHAEWDATAPEDKQMIRSGEDIPAEATSIAVSLDGIMVPLAKGGGGVSEGSWREASCGTVSFQDGEGNRLKTLYYGRMPESGKATLKGQLATTVAQVRDLRPDIRVAAIADGAVDNWTFLEGLDPDARALDFWHACQHLADASDHIAKEGWFTTWRRTLRDDPDGVGKVIRSLRYYKGRAKEPRGRETIRRVLNYFVKNRSRMRYSELRAEKLAIGSGVVEAANKTLVTARMKRSGMRWHINSGQAILSFRALQKSGFLESAWAIMMDKRGAAANNNFAVENLAIAA